MINRVANLTSRLAVLCAFLFTVAACGGGGGGGGGGFIPGEGGDVRNYVVTLELLDPDGNPTTTVTSSRPATVKVTVSFDRNQENPVEGEIVTVTTALAAITPASGTALTDETGVATFQLETAGTNGADTITVTVDSEDGVGEASLNYQVGLAGLRLGYFDNGSFIEGQILVEPDEQLSPAGTATLTFAVVDEDDRRADTEEDVRVTSECLVSNKATLTPASPVLVTGQITVDYTAAGCEGDDTITATLSGSGNQALGTITIAELTAGAISFQSAAPELIVLKGTGGGASRQESSTVTFAVVDAGNNPVSDVDVNFSLSTEVGGLSLGNLKDRSDANGLVTTTVFSGNVATAVRVFARIDDSDLSTTSDVLVVTTGLPDQNSISLSVAGGFVVEEGFTVDGKTRELTVRMADKYNNPVPDGTSAIFTTEYGAIESSCVLAGGSCSVTWTSQAPRFPDINTDVIKTITDPDYSCPSHNGASGPCPDDLGGIRGGRSTILVTALGEESFVDQNGNGQYDDGEPFVNLPEAFIDHNEDGVYTPALGPNCPNPPTSAADCDAAGFEETFVDFNNNGIYDTNDNPPLYNGTLCPPEGDGVFCSRDLVNVRTQSIVILSADSEWFIGLYRGRTPATSTQFGNQYNVYISDIFNNQPAANTSISVSVTAPCELEGLTSTTVPNTTATGAFGVSFIQEGTVDYNSCTATTLPDTTGTLTVSVGDTVRTFVCNAGLVDTSVEDGSRDALGDCIP